MASSYTNNSGIEKIETGAQSGTWGTTTNTNFDIIDRAISGVGAISLSGTTHTLTTSDGALSEGGYRVLVLGGTPSGTNTITITPNDQGKFYIVSNESGESAIFTQGSGGNVTVANGAKTLIYADGAGSGAAVTQLNFPLSEDAAPQLSANLDVNGNSITSTSNGNVVLAPNGTGDVQLDADTVRVGDSNADATITTNGTGDLTLNTNSGTDSGAITIADGANGDISISPNGTGTVVINTDLDVDNLNINGNTISSTDVNGDITLAPNSAGNVVLGNYTLQTDQSIGSITDGYVLTYDNGTGKVSLEAPTLNTDTYVAPSILTTTGETATAPSETTDVIHVRLAGGGGGGASDINTAGGTSYGEVFLRDVPGDAVFTATNIGTGGTGRTAPTSNNSTAGTSTTLTVTSGGSTWVTVTQAGGARGDSTTSKYTTYGDVSVSDTTKAKVVKRNFNGDFESSGERNGRPNFFGPGRTQSDSSSGSGGQDAPTDEYGIGGNAGFGSQYGGDGADGAIWISHTKKTVT